MKFHLLVERQFDYYGIFFATGEEDVYLELQSRKTQKAAVKLAEKFAAQLGGLEIKVSEGKKD